MALLSRFLRRTLTLLNDVEMVLPAIFDEPGNRALDFFFREKAGLAQFLWNLNAHGRSLMARILSWIEASRGLVFSNDNIRRD